MIFSTKYLPVTISVPQYKCRFIMNPVYINITHLFIRGISWTRSLFIRFVGMERFASASYDIVDASYIPLSFFHSIDIAMLAMYNHVFCIFIPHTVMPVLSALYVCSVM